MIVLCQNTVRLANTLQSVAPIVVLTSPRTVPMSNNCRNYTTRDLSRVPTPPVPTAAPRSLRHTNVAMKVFQQRLGWTQDNASSSAGSLSSMLFVCCVPRPERKIVEDKCLSVLISRFCFVAFVMLFLG